jgi:hypothetical protein
VVLAIAGCGGSNHKSSSSSSSASSTKATTTQAKPRPTGPTVVTEQVIGRGGKKLASSIKANPGTPVVLRTIVPSTKKENITITAPAGPSKTLKITASGGGHTSTATIHSRHGTPLTLVNLRYTCSLPPAPTFCPAKKATGDSHGYTLIFNAARIPGVLVSAILGPLNTRTPVVRTPTASSASPYTATVYVRALARPKPGTHPKPPTPTPPSTSATAKPGEVLTMATRLKGTPVGPPQPVTVTIHQGPSKTLTITASVAGGSTTTGTVTSANGKNIALVVPRFSCTVPPTPTNCPPTHVHSGNHQYQLTFMASPYTPPVTLSAQIQGG